MRKDVSFFVVEAVSSLHFLLCDAKADGGIHDLEDQ
jgi:hypothetical protein